MKNNALDRRRMKTREAIHEALYSLMMEMQYNKITIQDIIDRANVGRSTFYAHYQTKDELLIESITHLMDILNNYIISYVDYNGDTTRLIPVTELFGHIKENGKMMRGLIKSNSADLFIEKAQSYWNEKLKTYLSQKLVDGQEPCIPIEILVNHISSTLINLLKWWVENRMPYEPSAMDIYFQKLINPCIQSVINAGAK